MLSLLDFLPQPMLQSLRRLLHCRTRREGNCDSNSTFVAIEKLPFIKYPQICELESHHGVNLGTSYINENAGKEMIHYIAKSRRQELRQKLAKGKFFSLLLDGSSDAANIDNEITLAV